MTPDQLTRFEALAAKLADRLLDYADPDNMSGAGKLPNDLTKEDRGNLAWDLKIANSFGLVFFRILDTVQRQKLMALGYPSGRPGESEPDEEDMKRFEKEARRLVAEIGAKREK